IAMWFSGLIFGKSELSLRLPNIVASIFFLIYSYKTIKLIANKYIVVFFFLILVLNIFVFEFFSLARGYGISLCFMMISIYFLLKYLVTNEGRNIKFIRNSLLFAGLSVFSNMIFLNFFLALLGVYIISFIFDYFVKKRIKSIKFDLCSTIIILVTLGINICLALYLNSKDAYYWGNYNGIDQDIIKPLINVSFVIRNPGLRYETYELIKNCARFIAYFTIFFSALYFTVKSIKQKSIAYELLMLILILTLLLSQFLQFKLLSIPLPIRRTAIIYIPLFSLILILLFNNLSSLKYKAISLFFKTITFFIAFLVSVIFIRSMNLNKTTEWAAESDTKNSVYELINYDENSQKSLNITVFWIFHNTYNYYINKENLKWKCIRIDNVEKHSFLEPIEYFYLFEDNLKQIESRGYKFNVIKKYPFTKTVLIKVFN
ncbi:MAG: glycosyltransferase family 39 protein, partial [Bacteroidales bacterium]|nr:glycosyltransferase family 39 protein [Bacteroidales bacterium]